MRCIYYLDKKCFAAPECAEKEWLYKPEPVIVSRYCETNDFSRCPRYVAYIEHRGS